MKSEKKKEDEPLEEESKSNEMISLTFEPQIADQICPP